ncbi:MAG TPA: OsmC family protein [Candidatus Baltobacteraceae bacterium]|nr:OsmC family protein [Candidatus Baltobacteraceae bacterium]
MSTLTIERTSGYEFMVRVDEASVKEFLVEEGPPLGTGRSPGPDVMLGAAVGTCLSASLLFCLTKAHIDVEHLSAGVSIDKARDERGRLRIGSIEASLSVRVPADQRERFERCRTLFEDFCTVTQSVRAGIPVTVSTELS